MSFITASVQPQVQAALNTPMPLVAEDRGENSPYDMGFRSAGKVIVVEDVVVTGTGSVNLNVFQVDGTVRVLNTWAQITEVTTLANLTDMYADVWDGSVSAPLTKSPGASLSGAPVGTFFTKDKAISETYTVLLADQARVAEAATKGAVPFYVNQKNGVDTFIRFNFTTTDAPVSFKMTVWFEYQEINGGTLTLV